MRALVIYESMYGNTHAIAGAIGEGMRSAIHSGEIDVQLVPVADVDQAELDAADLVVVGGPTHVHGMSRESTREQAIADGQKPDSGLVVDADAEGGRGIREWLATVEAKGTAAAAFDTRVDLPALLTGRASKAIDKALRRHGFRAVIDPESFLVSKDNVLEPGEDDRAREWGRCVAQRLPRQAST